MTDFTGGPGFEAFVVVFLLALTVIALGWSVTRELRKVRTNPPPDDDAHGDDRAPRDAT